MKSGKSSISIELKDPATILCSKVSIILKEHLQDRVRVNNLDWLADVHVVFYLWGYETPLSKKAIGRANYISLIKDISEKCNVSQAVVTDHLALFLKTNVHQVCEPQLRDWMIPSFLPIPMLLKELNSAIADEPHSSPAMKMKSSRKLR